MLKVRSDGFAVALLLVCPMAWGQSAAPVAGGHPLDQGTITLKQEVRNVVIDVVVTDKHGHPVQSLPEGRFQIFENGVPQQIAFFEEQNDSEKAAPNTPAVEELPSDVHTNIEEVAANGPLMVLLLDALNTRPDQQSYVHAQVMEYLKKLRPGTRIAIFTLGDQLRLIQGFTSDPEVLKDALSRSAYPTMATLSPGGMMSGGNGGTTAAGSMIGLPVAQSVNDVRSSLERFGNESLNAGQELRIRYSLDALNAMSVYLAGIQGRKNLVWFTGSMPWSINPDFSLVTDPTGRVDYTDDLRQLANVMTAGRIAIYPVDAHALATPTGYGPDEASTAGMGVGGDASAAGPSFHGAGVGSTADNPVSSGAAFGTQQMVSQMNAAGNHMSMENLATATGGQALYNTNGIAGAVAKVRSIAEHYYTLAYSPTNKKYDGRLRQVDVKVSQPGVRLEYRRGYYADDPAKTARQTQVSYSNPLRAVMQRGAPDATQIPFRVQVKRAMQQPGAEQPQDRVGNEGAMLRGPVVRFDFHWNVNLHDVEFTATGNGMYHGEVDAVLDAFDGNGNILNNIYATLPLNLNDAEYKSLLKSGLPMKQALDVPVGLVYLRAGVLDPSTGFTGATEFPLTVKAAE